MRRLKLPCPPMDERGVALPLALVGLVSISLLVTTALVTSSTEVAISRAHQDATASLHTAEGSIQRYVGEKATAVTEYAPSPLVPVVKGPASAGYLMTVAQLAVRQERVGNEVRQLETYSFLAEPEDGRGRRAAAQIILERRAALFDIDVTAGLTIGGDIDVTGSSAISDGRNAACDSAAAPNALQVTSGAKITKGGAAKIEGKADTATYTKAEMYNQLLGGMTMPDLVKMANIKFAAGEFAGRAKSFDSSGPRPKTDRYNWGCPPVSADNCASIIGNTANMAYYPIVSIDAGGGNIAIEGNHGQGILIVHNGSAHIKGNLTFQGIVLVERDLIIEGTGSGGVKIEGAVVAFGENSTIKDSTAGNAVITYNKCQIAAAQEGANQLRVTSAPQAFPFALSSWQEVVQ